ncbi:MAG: hypothetical protein WKF84_04595 [Pyrinomonadaceae bacterium]
MSMPETEVSGDEFSSRYNFSVKFVYAIITLTPVLVALAFAGLYPRFNSFDPNLFIALRIAILFFGLGAVVVRRTRLNAARLVLSHRLRGASGLPRFATENNNYRGHFAGAIAVMAFIIAMRTGRRFRCTAAGDRCARNSAFLLPAPHPLAARFAGSSGREIKDQPVTKGSTA